MGDEVKKETGFGLDSSCFPQHCKLTLHFSWFSMLYDILACDKVSLDIFWIKDKSLADLDHLPAPEELADDIIENLQSALEAFQELKAQLG